MNTNVLYVCYCNDELIVVNSSALLPTERDAKARVYLYAGMRTARLWSMGGIIVVEKINQSLREFGSEWPYVETPTGLELKIGDDLYTIRRVENNVV